MNTAMKQCCQGFTIPCGVIDSESEVYTNAAMMDMLALSAASSQVLALFRAQETVMRRETLPLSLLSTLPGRDSEPAQPWLFSFFPHCDERQVYTGTFFHARPFLFLSLLEYVDGVPPYPLNFYPLGTEFNALQGAIIFFTLQMHNSRAIARKLHRSFRTIDNNLQLIYRKVGVNNRQQFKHYCRANGLNQYIPAGLMPAGQGAIGL